MLTARPPDRDQYPLRRPLLPVASAVVTGILLDRHGGEQFGEMAICWYWAMASVCLLVVAFAYQRFPNQTLLIPLLVALICVGASWHHLRWHYYATNQLARYSAQQPQPVCVQAIAMDRVRYRPAPPSSQLRAISLGPISELVVRATKVRDGRSWRPVSGLCKLRVRGELTGVMAGDQLHVFAMLSQPSQSLNPGEYDWRLAERTVDRHCRLFGKHTACVRVIKSGSRWSIRRWLHRVGQQFQQRLAAAVGPNQSDLAQAIVLGARHRVDSATYSRFRRTGTIHLLVVSGLHVGLVALAIWLLVAGSTLPHRTGLVITALSVLAYASVVGWQPPVMRASVLVVLTLASYAWVRRVALLNLLAAALLVVLAWYPAELYRAGTQLSFLCVATLITYGADASRSESVDPLTRLLRATRPLYWKGVHRMLENLRRTAQVSFAIWIVTGPLIAYHFHITAPICILITPLLLPLTTVALITGLMICLIGWIAPPIAWGLGAVCAGSLWLVRELVEFACQLDWGSSYLAGPTFWWVALYYCGLLVLSSLSRQRFAWPWQLAAVLLWVTVGLVVTGLHRDNSELRCTFLSVGHGTCVVLELPAGETLLYDAGSLGSPERTAQTIATFLWSRGITRLDGVVLSHADIDHYNALPGLMERFEISKVYVSPHMFPAMPTEELTEDSPSPPQYLQQLISDAGIQLQTIWQHDRLPTSSNEVTFEVLHPSQAGVDGSDNANSLTLAIRFAEHAILLPGDLEAAGLDAVTQLPPQACTILLAPHHGSRNSDPPGFARWCQPKWVVVSGPRVSDDQQFTAQSYRQVGAEVLHTAEVGAVTFRVCEGEITRTQFLVEQ